MRKPRDSQPVHTLLDKLLEDKQQLERERARLDAEVAGTMRAFRLSASLTQADLAAGLGKSQAYVSQVENSERSPSAGLITAFASFASNFDTSTGTTDAVTLTEGDTSASNEESA